MSNLTASLNQHLGALRLHWRRHRAFPSMEELAAVLGVKSKGGVHKTLGRLVDEGLLERVGSRYAPTETFFMAECHELFDGSDHFHFADSSAGGYTPVSFAEQVAADRHRKMANYLFVDGHAGALSWSKVQTNLVRAGAQLVRPDGNP